MSSACPLLSFIVLLVVHKCVVGCASSNFSVNLDNCWLLCKCSHYFCVVVGWHINRKMMQIRCVLQIFFLPLQRFMDKFEKTNGQFEQAVAECRTLFEKKLHDYGASWRILRPTSLTDQLFIKAKRIRQLETTGLSLVGEGIRPEFIGLVNYGIVGLIQLAKGCSDTVDITSEEAMALYDRYAREALELMKRKNHDYDEAWRDMRVSSYTDLILTKIQRVKEMEDLAGETLVSEGIDANYMDIINYSVFALIKLL